MEKTKYYYYPLCTNDYVFDNIFASESVSPICFYKLRQFGIDYFYKIPKIHNENALILFNQPPKFSLEKSNTDNIKFILAIDTNSIKEEGIISIGKEDIIGYQKTIYLNKDNFKIYFFSDKDKKIAWMKSENSLPTKGLKKYENNFLILSENICKEFNLNNIENVKIECNSYQEIYYDRKFNYFKGLVYGISVGIISQKSKEEILIKKSLQEITNTFAEFKNRIENDSKKFRETVKYSKYNIDNSAQNYISNLKDRLSIVIRNSEELYHSLFPDQAFSEQNMIDFLIKDRPNLFKSVDKVKELIELRKFDDEVDRTNKYNQLVDFYLRKSNKRSFYDKLKLQISNYIDSLRISNNYNKKEEVNNNFKEILYELEQYISKSFLKNTADKKFDFSSLKFDFKKNEIVFDENFQKLTKSEIEELTSIINLILNNTKQGKGETSKKQILSIVEKVGDVNTKKRGGGRSTVLYKYLNNEISEYPSQTPRSVVMLNFVAFTFSPDSLEKLQNYLETRSIDKSWIGYAFWCTFNGFANISKNFVKPIFDINNETLQREIDTYLENSFLAYNSFDEFFSKKNDEKNVINVFEIESSYQNTKTQLFYNLFDIQKKYNISLDELDEILLNRDNRAFPGKIKSKKDLKTLFEAFDKFIIDQELYLL